MNWNNLKAGIAAVVKENNNQEITGSNLQNVLITMVNSLGANATYGGIAHPNTSPGTPDGPVFWFASEPGVYSNFGNTEIDNTGIFTWDGDSWSFEEFDFGGNIEIINDLITGGADKALSAEQGKDLNTRLSAMEAPFSGANPPINVWVTDVDNTLDFLLSSKLNKNDVVDNLTSDDGTKALSAKQGKILNEKFPAAFDEMRNILEEELNQAVESIVPIVVEGDVSNAPDEEDLTSVTVGQTDVLKFKDKVYSPLTYSGLGRKYLRKNMVSGVNTLTQAMFKDANNNALTNTVFVIQYDYVIGSDITIPSNCVLEFDGGSIKAATGATPTLNFTNTWLEGKVSLGVQTDGTLANEDAYMWWFGDDIDLWHTFINQVEGVVRYSYSSGVYNATIRVSKSVDDTFIVEGNGAEIRMALEHFGISSGGTSYLFSVKPKDLTITTYNVIEAVAKEAQTIKVDSIEVSGETLAVGDCIAIRDSAIASYNPERDYRSCEFAFITEIKPVDENDLSAGYYVKLNHATYGHYNHINSRWIPSDEAPSGSSIYDYAQEETNVVYVEANKFKTISVSVKNLKLRMTDYDGTGDYPKLTGTQYPYAVSISRAIAVVENVECYDFSTCIKIDKCQYSYVRDCICVVNRLYGEAATAATNPYDGTDSYGLVIGNSQFVVVDGGRYEGGNHGITHGGNYDNKLAAVNRFVTISNTQSNSIKAEWNFSIDAHSDSEYITLRNNTAKGLALGGDRFTIENNKVNGTIEINCLSYNQKVDGNTAKTANVWYQSRLNYNKVYGNWQPETTRENLVITNNKFGTLQVLVRSKDYYYPNSANIYASISNNIITNRPVIHIYPNGNTFSFSIAGAVLMSNNDLTEGTSNCAILGNDVKILNNIIRGTFGTRLVGKYVQIANNIFDGAFPFNYIDDIGATSISLVNNTSITPIGMLKYMPSDNAATKLYVIGNVNTATYYNYKILDFAQSAGQYSTIYAFNNVLGNINHITIKNAKSVIYKGNTLSDKIVAPIISDYTTVVSNLDNLTKGSTANRPTIDVRSEDFYQPYYDTTLNKLLVANPHRVGSSITNFTRNAGTHSFSTISSFSAAEKYVEGALMQVSVDRSGMRVFAFSKTNPSFSGSIFDDANKVYLDDMIVVLADTSLTTAFFVVPNVTTYPYIYTETQSASQTHFYVYEASVYTDTDGKTPAASKGATTDRPTLTSDDAGFTYWDTSLGKMIAWNGSDWVNLDGTALS